MNSKAILSALIVTILVPAATTSALADSLVGYAPGRLVLELAPGFTPEITKTATGLSVDDPGLQQLTDRYAVEMLERLHPYLKYPDKAAADELSRQWIVEFDPATDLDEAVAAYAALPGVRKVYKDEIRYLHAAVPNDPDLEDQWYLRAPYYGRPDVRWLGGWAETKGDSNVVIAIIDSGVDWQHPDLGGTNADYTDGCIRINWTEYFGTPGVDDDGNSRIDDIRGWDFVTSASNAMPGEDTSVADNDPMDFGGHGTGCAGCAAAITDNGIGISGMAGGAKIMPLRTGWLQSSGLGVVGTVFCSTAIIYAANEGADIINCSWGSSSYLGTAVNYAASAGVIIVNAAGNDNDENPEYLDNSINSISVAALNSFDLRAGFSNYGTWVEISAPGDDIRTTWFNYLSMSSSYATVDGTSFAAPIVCGAIAMLKSANPGMSKSEIISLLYDSCDDIYWINPAYVGKLGAGRVNLLKALGDGVHQVPDEFEFLQDAASGASPGDTIAFRSSHALSGPIDIYKKELHYLGGWDDLYATRDPVDSPTVITGTTSAPALRVPNDVGADIVVDGFRCTGGAGQVFAGIPYAGDFGGGLVVYGDAVLRNLDVTGNVAGAADALGGGGGVIFEDSAATMESSRIHGNQSVHGWGVYVHGGAPTLIDCEIYDNASVGYTLDDPLGGGLYVTDADLTMSGCTVSGHHGVHSGGGLYAVDHAGATGLDLSGSLVHDNTATAIGGGLFLSVSGAVALSGNTVVDNEAAAGGGGIHAVATTASIANTIVAFNGGAGVEATGSSLTFACNDVHGNTGAGYAGVADPTGSDGNVSVDPTFCDPVAGDYTVEDTSPCLPAQSGGCGLIGALGEGCVGGTDVDDGPGAPPARFAVEPNFPNPFNPSTTIRFALPEAAVTTLRVYDVTGRLVRTLVEGELPAAVQAVEWRGDDDQGRSLAAGVYFYRIRSGAHLHTGQMALIK